VCNGGAGVLNWLPKVRVEKEKHRRMEEVRREGGTRERCRNRDEGEGVTTTDTHECVHSRKPPLPHCSHIHT